MFENPYSDGELERHVKNIRTALTSRGLDVGIFSTPDSVFYLIGLDHWGYFAPTHLVVPVEGEITLVTRAMERVVIGNQVRNAKFEGHTDSETAIEKLIEFLKSNYSKINYSRNGSSANGKLRIGIEEHSSGFSYHTGKLLASAIEFADFEDITGLSDKLRRVKSPEEQDLIRAAGKTSTAGTLAAISAIHDGAREVDVAAECLAAMTRAGSAPPGFGPFIRPHARVAEEHTTWGDGIHKNGDHVMLEIAGCVGRYNAPMGRFVHVGSIKDEDAKMAEICANAFQAILDSLKKGVRAKDVYDGWQAVVNDAGMPDYRRQHCGYFVGIGFPPTWTGGNYVAGLKFDSDIEIEEGMTFHAMSWFTNTGAGEFFISNTVLLGPNGPELLTEAPMEPIVK